MIRLLGSNELETFRTIRLEALRCAPAAYASTVASWETLSDEEWRRRMTENSVFVAFHADEPIGMMGLKRERSVKRVHRASLVMVYLRESARGTGMAAQLLEKVIDHARAQGIRQLELVVNAENTRAILFYRRQGFTEMGRIPAALIDGTREIDEVLMMRRLDAPHGSDEYAGIR